VTASLDGFSGCLLGLALGDALGAPFEGGPLERLAWRVMGTTRTGEMRWTDDTQMSLDLAESLIEHRALVLDDVAQRFAHGYRWSRGYGPGTVKLLSRIRSGQRWHEASRSVFRDGSFGNGGAMRVPVVALFATATGAELVDMARASASVTHSHELGLEGAMLIAAATSAALHEPDALGVFDRAARHCQLESFLGRLQVARSWLTADADPSHGEVCESLGRGMTALESCVTALYLACRYWQRPFLELQTCVARLGGDADTIGAMAGAVWGAHHGARSLPEMALCRLEQRARLEQVALALFDLGAATA
jgi:ADP-ribosylglycohydrolase